MTNVTTRFADLNLSRHIASALEKIGYETPTPIQAQAIPHVLQGRDIQGIAQTGTGKTAAFSLPILSHIADDPQPAPKRSTRVLVLSPTRELASQIGENMKNYARHIDGFRSTVVFGGVSVSKQVKKIVPGNDVIVATPGRLLDLIQQKILHLNNVEYLVLDEADQMMDMGFIHTLRKIIPLLPKERQTLFFSATMPKSISQLASKFLTDPVKIAVSPESTTAERVVQSIIYATKAEKQNLLALKLLDPAVEKALVFTRTKHGADRVVKRLASVGLDSRAIHGNKSQGQRTRALTAFKDGEVNFLIATDVAARGIDIRGVSHVFNFEIPNVPEQYVHRIGRTGRAGEAGIAISFVAPDEKAYLKDIQKILKQSIEVKPLPSDFVEASKGLKKRPAIEKAPEPERQARRRKGRTSRPSNHRKGPKNEAANSDALDTPSGRPQKKTDPKNPSRAERKRQKAGTARKPRDGEEGKNRDRQRDNKKNSRSGDRKDNRSDSAPRRQSGTRDESGSEGENRRKHSGSGASFKRKPRGTNEDRAQGGRPHKPRSKPARNSGGGQSNNRSDNQDSKPKGNKPQGGGQNNSQGGRPQGGGSQGGKGGGWSSPKRKTTGRKPGGNRGGRPNNKPSGNSSGPRGRS